uniref:beta-D-galactosyl-(1->3)-N-acetyl-beta-D-galactosaminide alpha-2,3-sialyltransferase n=1 Tax=Suricata suricatta TaxID=37032 RepID=A0A673TRI3_SURSU
MCYLSVLESGIPGTARVLFEGEQMDMEAGDDRLRGGVAWTVGEPWRPMGQRDAGASAPPSSQSQGINSVSGLGKMWEKVFKVIHRPSVSHFHLYCGTCTLLGNSKILQGSGLRNNVNQWTAAFRMNPDPVQSTEIMGNQTTGRFISPGKASSQGSWRQPVLPLKLSGLAWTSDAPSEEV